MFTGDGHSPIGRVAVPIVSHCKKPTEIPHDDGMTIPQIPCFEHVMPCSKVLEVVPGSEALGPSPKHTRAERYHSLSVVLRGGRSMAYNGHGQQERERETETEKERDVNR